MLHDVNFVIYILKKVKLSGYLKTSTCENINIWIIAFKSTNPSKYSVIELVKTGAWSELNSRFCKNLNFGTGGIRARTIGAIISKSEIGEIGCIHFPRFPATGMNALNDVNVSKMIIGIFRYIKIQSKSKDVYKKIKPSIVVAHDMRHFSYHFCNLITSVWVKLGGNACRFTGPRSTPQLSFTVRRKQFNLGIMITASHNPPSENGCKIYFTDGSQITNRHTNDITKYTDKIRTTEVIKYLNISCNEVLVLGQENDHVYIQSLRRLLIQASCIDSRNLSIVHTALHGTGSVSIPPLLRSLGIEVFDVEKQLPMNPNFPTVSSPNPEDISSFDFGIKLANLHNVNYVIASDPDSDRMRIAVRRRNGSMCILNGNIIGSLLAEHRMTFFKKIGVLNCNGNIHSSLIKTFVTTPLQQSIAKNHGVRCINTLTGFKWIGSKLLQYEYRLRGILSSRNQKDNYYKLNFLKRSKLYQKYSIFFIFGGEESYGYLAGDDTRDKDGNGAALMFCELISILNIHKLHVEDLIESMHDKYGYFYDDLINIYYINMSGERKVKNIINSYIVNPPRSLNSIKVIKVIDFRNHSIKDSNDAIVVSQDFFILKLENGYNYAIRQSGTESKIKIYLFAYENTFKALNLKQNMNKSHLILSLIESTIVQDNYKRSLG